jgi:hypothetical protein
LTGFTPDPGFGSQASYDANHPVLVVDTSNSTYWWLMTTYSYGYRMMGNPTGTGSFTLGTITIYYSPDGTNYTAFPA